VKPKVEELSDATEMDHNKVHHTGYEIALSAAKYAEAASRSANLAARRAREIRAMCQGEEQHAGWQRLMQQQQSLDEDQRSLSTKLLEVTQSADTEAAVEVSRLKEMTPLLLNLGLWLTTCDLSHLVNSSSSLYKHCNEICCWSLKEGFGLSILGWNASQEMSPLRALAFAIKACKGRKEAQNQGLAMGLHVSVLLKQGCIYTWRRSGVPTSQPSLRSLRLPCLVRMVACGGDHSLLLAHHGHVFAFGKNDMGQLGLGHTEDVTEPEIVEGVSDAVQAACGADHSLILTTVGSLWSAGRGSEGQLGIEDEVEVVSKFFCSVSSGVAQIASGADHSTYLDFYGGAWSFGENSRGQLGLGHCERVAGPHRMLLPGALAVGIQCGGTHTLILSDTSEVYGCGGNDKGQLGDKDLRPVSLPFKLALPALARRISCGFSHSLILCRTGELWVLGEKRLRRLSELHGKQVRQMSAGGDQCLLWATERRKSKASEAILLSFNVNTEDLNVVNVSP